MGSNASRGEALEVQGVKTSNHYEWLTKGGVTPEKPEVGMKRCFRIVDYQDPSRDSLRRQVAEALKEDGFFVLINHTVPPVEVEGMLSMARRMFNRLRDDAQGKRNKVALKIQTNEMLRPMTKAARGFSFFEEETLNPFMGADQKFTFDYALQNDAAFIGRRAAFERESAALDAYTTMHPDSGSARAHALKERYTRLRTCQEHLGKNLWPDEESAEEDSATKSQHGGGDVASVADNVSTPMRPFNSPQGPHSEPLSGDALRQSIEKYAESVERDATAQKAPCGFRSTCEHYLADLYPLSRDLLTLILEGAAGLTTETIESKVMPLFDDPLVIHRLISYPPQKLQPPLCLLARTEDQPDARALRAKASMSCGAHVDYGALTMIAEDHGMALEIERRDVPGEYEYLPELPKGALVVSTGFMLEKLTNGAIPATRHRVQNIARKDDTKAEVDLSLSEQKPTTRTAMAFFLDPHPEAFIEPLPECIDQTKGQKPLYEGCVAGAKGVRFGDPRYLSQIATNVDKMRLGVADASSPPDATQQR